MHPAQVRMVGGRSHGVDSLKVIGQHGIRTLHDEPAVRNGLHGASVRPDRRPSHGQVPAAELLRIAARSVDGAGLSRDRG